MEQFFGLKEGSLGRTDRYQGVNVEKIQDTDDRVIWSMNCQEYTKNTIDKVKKFAEEY